MCGIAGVVDFLEPVAMPTLVAMRERLAHRGPDDAGAWVDNDRSPFIGLGHRRLAILDRSPAGRQPMTSHDGQLTVVFNGEIYNYRELARELEQFGHSFRTQSDTEVLLAAYAQWGAACVERFNGMWAIALWDAPQRQLFLSRDRFGKKPLYYHWNGHRLVFASEMKAIFAHGDIARRPDESSLARYCESFALPTHAATMYETITMLPAAHSLSLDHQRQLTTHRYWQLDPAKQVRHSSDAGYVEEFRALFDDAVRIRLRSDVPVGSSLSGGLDSSMIVGTIARLRNESGITTGQHTFSARFPEQPTFDEGAFIDAVVEQTGVQSHITVPNVDDLLNDWRRLHEHQEEPFLSSSVFAQWQVMRLARQNQTVVLLDGQGSDEILAGYAPHVAYRLFDLAAAGKVWSAWREYRAVQARQRELRKGMPGAASRAQMFSFGSVIRKLLKRGRAVKSSANAAVGGDAIGNKSSSRLWRRLHDDLTRRSIPLLLRYVDRNAMAFGVEVRNPFLDYRLVEFLMGVPDDLKLRDGWSKHLLREAGRGVLPEKVRTRTDKVAFITPEDQWLRGPLKSWAADMLFGPRLRALPGFSLPRVEQAWREHQAGRSRREELWPWLSLSEWLAMNESSVASAPIQSRAA